MVRLLFLVLFSLSACHSTSSSQPAARLSYAVSIEPALQTIRVTGQLSQVRPGTYYFVLPRTQGLPLPHFIKNLKFDDAQGPLEMVLTSDNDWKVTTKSTAIRYTYEINLQQSNRYADQAWGGATNQMDDRMAFLNGSFTFIIPLIESIGGPVAVSWQVPPAWKVATPWTVGARGTDIPSPYALVRNYYTVFKEGSVKTTRIKGLDLTTIWLGDDNINNYTDATFTIRRVVEAALSLFGEEATANKESITLIFRDVNTRNQFRASTEANSIEFNFKKGVTFEQVWRLNKQSFLRILAHELMHTWDRREIDKASAYTDVREWGPDTCWIREGFTEYFAMLNLYKSDVFDRQTFVNTMQSLSDASQRVYDTQPISLMQSCRSFMEDEGAMHYAYTAGASLAFKMDLELRRQTNGIKSLPDFMRHFMETYRYEEKTVEAFMSEWQAYAPSPLNGMAAGPSRVELTSFEASLRALDIKEKTGNTRQQKHWEIPVGAAFLLYFE